MMEEEIPQFKIVKNPRKMHVRSCANTTSSLLSLHSRVLKEVKELIFRKIFIKNSVQSSKFRKSFCNHKESVLCVMTQKTVANVIALM